MRTRLNGLTMRRRAAAGAGREALHRDRLADARLGDDERVDVEIVVVLGIGDRRGEHLADVDRHRLRARSARMLSASPTFLPRIRPATRLSFCARAADRGRRPQALPCRRPCGGMLACPSALALLVGGVAGEVARRRELAELHADHVLVDRDRHELAAVVDVEGQADELRQDRRAARPGLDRRAARRRPARFPPSSAGDSSTNGPFQTERAMDYPFFFA